MAIVPNLANRFTVTDVPYTTPNRVNAGPPATAMYAGEIVYDSTAKACIVALGAPSAPAWAPYVYGWDAD
jgi:hypothetical protein